jgi:hypothetical protein
MFVTADLQTIFHTLCIRMFMDTLCPTFYVPSSSASLVIATKSKAKDNFHTAANPPKNYRDKSYTLFPVLRITVFHFRK